MEFYFNGRYAGAEAVAAGAEGTWSEAASGGFFARQGTDADGDSKTGRAEDAGTGFGRTGAALYPLTVRARKKSNGAKVLIKIWPKDAPEGRIECEIWKAAYKGLYIESRTEGGRLVMARKWIDGEPLDAFAKRNGPCGREEAAEIVLAVARKLKDFYEETGMYHGDLKPENVVYDGEDVFLIDFESAGPEPRGGSAPKTAGAKTVRLVSEGFSAPEISRGMPCCRSDFYSLGMILAFLITGRTGPEAVDEIGGPVGRFAAVCTDPAVGRRFGGVEELANALRSAVREEALQNGSGDSLEDAGVSENPEVDQSAQTGDRVPPGTVSVENMNVTAARITFNVAGAEKTAAADNTSGEKNTAGADTEPVQEEPSESEEDAEEKQDVPEPPAETDAEDRVILFPHIEKGYRKLILYVPGNVAFAAEFGFVTSSYMGFKTCVYEICDCTNPRIEYYLEPGLEESGAADLVKIAAAEGRRDAEREFIEEASEPETVYVTSGAGVRGSYEEEGEDPFFETERCSFGRNLFFGSVKEEPGTAPGDAEMRDFMSWAYGEFDITVICDSTRESAERRNGFMRFCDYVLVPVETDADSVEAEIAHYTWLLRNNGISLKRLKLAGWERVCDEGAEDAFPEGAAEERFLGFIAYDRRRHYTKNAEGGFYCRSMPHGIVSEYCRIAGALAYGDRSCA
ncbi:MAG: phosphotransferase [Clostridia bacterium]|nr:phosphotransferase [Clostridia bacterium]